MYDILDQEPEITLSVLIFPPDEVIQYGFFKSYITHPTSDI